MELKWPAWLPYPVSWLRAFVNLVCFSLVMQEITIPWVMENSCTGESCSDEAVFVVLITLITHFIWLTIAHYLLAKLLKLVPWIQLLSAWKEGLNGLIVVTLLLCGLVILSLALALSPRILVTAFVRSWLWVATAISAYLYHYDFLVRERRAARKRSRQVKNKTGKGREQPSPITASKSATPPPPVDPIELELDRLRGEMGLNQMKNRKKGSGNT
jgi:hypothetical protein